MMAVQIKYEGFKMRIMAFENSRSIEDVVELINNDFADTGGASSEEVAGLYSYNGAKDGGYGLEEEDMECHLDTLVENGAVFDYETAKEIALELAKKAKNNI